VRLGHNDPTAKPIVRNEFYSQAADLERMIAGLRMTLDICAQPAMKPYAAEPFTTPDGDSDEALHAAHGAQQLLDLPPGGTCRMGSDFRRRWSTISCA